MATFNVILTITNKKVKTYLQAAQNGFQLRHAFTPVLEHVYAYDNLWAKKIKYITYNIQIALDEIDILGLILFVLFLKNTISQNVLICELLRLFFKKKMIK
jgi:hypothetical protein